ncbi:uncharacterized protein LOC121050118 isoform X2 [Rosa chinensis]|uniref:uncharacterized protein LOC121050118 isoform X2 n=1 Tax=Rosa chinensis TaxID=74649 RepID=UPI001AD90C72|nr:uncharacterized protein LOC121050118 isoform X2 [Rosa chinensis]
MCTGNNKLIVASQKVQVQARTLIASAGRNFGSKSHFITGIWWTRLLEALQGNIEGKLSSLDTNFMFHVLAGLFFMWLILRLVQSHLLCCGGKEGKR